MSRLGDEYEADKLVHKSEIEPAVQQQSAYYFQVEVYMYGYKPLVSLVSVFYQIGILLCRRHSVPYFGTISVKLK